MLARDVLPFLPNVGVEHLSKIRANASWELVHYHIPLHAMIYVILVYQKAQSPYAKRHLALYGSHHEPSKIHFCEMVNSMNHFCTWQISLLSCIARCVLFSLKSACWVHSSSPWFNDVFSPQVSNLKPLLFSMNISVLVKLVHFFIDRTYEIIGLETQSCIKPITHIPISLAKNQSFWL